MLRLNEIHLNVKYPLKKRNSLCFAAQAVDAVKSFLSRTPNRTRIKQVRSDCSWVLTQGLSLLLLCLACCWTHETQTGYGNKKCYLHPWVKRCPSKWSLNNFKLQSNSRQKHLSGGSRDRIAGLAPSTQQLFMLKQHNCFVTFWLFFSQTITVFLFSPLSSTECKSLRTFETDLFTMNMWKTASLLPQCLFSPFGIMIFQRTRVISFCQQWYNQNGLHLFTLPIICQHHLFQSVCLFDLVTFHQNSINKDRKYCQHVPCCLFNPVICFIFTISWQHYCK